MAGFRRGYSPGDAGYLELKRLEVRAKQAAGREANPTLQGMLLWQTDELRRQVESDDWAASERQLRRMLRLLSEGRGWLSRES